MPTDLSTAHDTRRSIGARPPLPHRLRLLFVGPEEPPWALLALRLESAGCDQAEFDWETDGGNALARLRKATFDCIVVLADAAGQPEALRFAEGLRASGSDEPVVVVVASPHDEQTTALDDLDCELLATTSGWHSRALVSMIRRAVARGDQRREMAGLEVSARRGRLRERDEAEGQLVQLRELIARFVSPPEDRQNRERPVARPDIVAKIDGLYRELLRTYVMMGSGNLAAELERLAELMSLAGLSPIEATAVHLEQVESLLQGLGSRSSRHVMSRADLLVIELLIRLGESYRKKSALRGLGATGLGEAGIDLLHAESLLQRPTDHAI